MQDVLAVVTVVVVGLMVGVEFAVAVFVNPILDRLPNDGGVEARSDGARVLGRVMPFWYIGSVVLGAVWSTLTWGDAGASLVAAGAVLLVVSVVMSILLLVPINSRVATWSQEGVPADWKQQVGRWDRFHYVRVGVIVLAFTLFAVALV
ncbi:MULTISPECIES: anthrone oxygenase family protein [unclassified Streptomyces]|uniref:anthrone oxygenase family protein n=1 Tax=unclassified Streptomyces TaxID=2593676 RepID=UPI0037D2A1FE